MDDRSKLIAKVNALLARGDSDFEEEARTSLFVARKLMKQHGIQYSELDGKTSPPRQRRPKDTKIDLRSVIQESLHLYMARIGQRGGLKGGKARSRALSSKRRSEIARLGAIAMHQKMGHLITARKPKQRISQKSR